MSNSASRMVCWKWWILLATMGCYLFYYCGRFNLAICMKPISEEFGWDKAEMGFLATVFIWAYGAGQFFNGNLADRFGRVLMPLGAVVSCAANWAFSYAPGVGREIGTALGWAETTGMVFFIMGAVWSVNAVFQAMGLSPGGKLISNWWPQQERGMAMGAFLFSAAMSNVVAFLLASQAADLWGWRAAFRYPVLLMALVAVVFYLLTKDRPEDVGLESPHRDPGLESPHRDPGLESPHRDPGLESPHKEPELESPHKEPEPGAGPSTSIGRYKSAFGNRNFVLASLSFGLHNVVRLGLLSYLPIFFMESYGWEIKSAGLVSAALPFGMAFGAISGGFISDWMFGGRRKIVIAGSLVLCAVCVFVLPMLAGGTGNGEVDLSDATKIGVSVMLVVSGYTLYLAVGPYFSLPADLLGPETAGTGIGLIAASAYAGGGAGTAVAGVLIEYCGYPAGFTFMAACAAVGAVVILAIREPSGGGG